MGRVTPSQADFLLFCLRWGKAEWDEVLKGRRSDGSPRWVRAAYPECGATWRSLVRRGLVSLTARPLVDGERRVVRATLTPAGVTMAQQLRRRQ